MVIISEVIGNTVMSSNFLNILQELPRGKKWLYSHFSGVKFYYIFQNHSQCLTGGTGGTTRKICVCGGGGGELLYNRSYIIAARDASERFSYIFSVM